MNKNIIIALILAIFILGCSLSEEELNELDLDWDNHAVNYDKDKQKMDNIMAVYDNQEIIIQNKINTLIQFVDSYPEIKSHLQSFKEFISSNEKHLKKIGKDTSAYKNAINEDLSDYSLNIQIMQDDLELALVYDQPLSNYQRSKLTEIKSILSYLS